MLTWLLSKWSWKSFAIGAGTAIFGGTIARPVLVSAVKAGMDVQDKAARTFEQARNEFGRIRDEASQQRSAGAQAGNAELLAELQKLREEIASLRSGSSKTTPKA